MIIDSHCHAWPRWPYQPPVPDDEHRGKVEQLLNEMDLNGVDQAVIVCARIDRNPDNITYIAEQIKKYPSRLHQIADVDCSWSDTYHTPGAADRLIEIAAQYPIKGFTHYLKDEDDGAWLYSEDGLKFFQAAAERKLIASIASSPWHQAAIRKVAEAFPSLPILCHHLGVTRMGKPDTEEHLKEVLESAKLPNIFIKVSGFAYCSQVNWDYPYSDTLWMMRKIYEHFGPHRLCWGSDYPVVRFFMTYKHSLEVFRTHCTFIPEADKALILGDTLAGLLAVGQAAGL